MTDHDTQPQPDAPGQAHWLDRPGNVAKLVWALVALCAVLLAFEFAADRYGPFLIEHVFGFYAIFGLGASFVVVLLTRMLRPVVARREDYYDG